MEKENQESITFIAEIGLNHNGNFDLIYELIRQAKLAGADIAKFQCGWRQNKDEINHLNPERLNILRQWCEYFSIEFLTSIITKEAYQWVKNLSPNAYKIASRSLIENKTLVDEIVAEGKKTYVSLGFWESENLPYSQDNVHYLWCKSKYPSTPWDLLDLPKDFKNSPYLGFSDHSIGIETSLIAICRGAKVIEKHFTLDKSDTTIRDHALSATPDEFKQMVNLGREIGRKIELGI